MRQWMKQRHTWLLWADHIDDEWDQTKSKYDYKHRYAAIAERCGTQTCKKLATKSVSIQTQKDVW